MLSVIYGVMFFSTGQPAPRDRSKKMTNTKKQNKAFKPAYKTTKKASLEIKFVNALIAYSKANGTAVKVGA